MNTQDILDARAPELDGYFGSLGEPPYRRRQVLDWIYRKLAASFDEMSDLPRALRRKLSSDFVISSLVPVSENVSADGQTRKLLFRLSDGKTIESSLMLYPGGASRERGTVCLSTQVGCPIGCPFCATGQQGFERNLSAGEIIGQALYFCRTAKLPGSPARAVSNIVFMGMGEPLANYTGLTRAIAELNTSLGIGIRQITVSTAGLAPAISRLSKEKVNPELSVSLHAPDDRLRDRLVPLNRKYPLAQLITACRDYLAATGRRPTFEYALFQGINDSPRQAADLAGRLESLNCHVNLIAGNRTPNGAFAPPPPGTVRAFRKVLIERGIAATIRLPRGADIEAGCGQLRSRYVG